WRRLRLRWALRRGGFRHRSFRLGWWSRVYLGCGLGSRLRLLAARPLRLLGHGFGSHFDDLCRYGFCCRLGFLTARTWLRSGRFDRFHRRSIGLRSLDSVSVLRHGLFRLLAAAAALGRGRLFSGFLGFGSSGFRNRLLRDRFTCLRSFETAGLYYLMRFVRAVLAFALGLVAVSFRVAFLPAAPTAAATAAALARPVLVVAFRGVGR